MADEDEHKALEIAAGRLDQLSSSIQRLKVDIAKSNPLPAQASLQASVQIIQRNLQSVLECVQENDELFKSTAIHPSTNFPGRTQENVLTQLLRKKPEPNIEEQVQKGRETAGLVTQDVRAQIRETHREMREWLVERIAKYVREEAGDPYTKEEREMGVEKVRTGLRRKLEEDSDDDDDDDDDGDDDADADDGTQDAGEARPEEYTGPELEMLIWLAEHGDIDIPDDVEFERKVGRKRGWQGFNRPPNDIEGESRE